jgi:CheY-like chemotaxis protein
MSAHLRARGMRTKLGGGARAFLMMRPTVATLVSHELAHQGFTIGRASNYDDALRILSAEPYDLVMLDLELPDGTSAAELARALRHDRLAASRKAWILVHAEEVADGELRTIKNSGVSSLILGAVSLGTITERLRMMHVDRREFVDALGYVGPDRRVRSVHFPSAADRRDRGKPTEDTGPAQAPGERATA